MSHPAAYYLVSSVMICVGCMSILGPIFGPKYAQRNKKEPRGRMASSVIIPKGKIGGISGLGNSIASSALNSKSGFRSGLGSSNESGGTRSAKGSHGLASGTFHHTIRSQHSGDPTPFGSTSQSPRSASEHVPPMKKHITEYDEEEDMSASFHVG